MDMVAAWLDLDSDGDGDFDRDEVGATNGREPVRYENAGAPGQQPLGGGDDPGLGERVHPCGGLVEHDQMRRVALHAARQIACIRQARYAKSLFNQKALQQVAQALVVVNDQDVRR
jgi:hypothetical protein